MGTISDINLYAKAFRDKYPISPKYRELIIQKLMVIISSPTSRNREVIAAIKAMFAAEAINAMTKGHDEAEVYESDGNRYAALVKRIRNGNLAFDASGHRPRGTGNVAGSSSDTEDDHDTGQ